MADSQLHMLRYWIEDKGIETALDEYYPDLSRNDPILSAAYVRYKEAVWAINKRAREIVDENQPEN